MTEFGFLSRAHGPHERGRARAHLAVVEPFLPLASHPGNPRYRPFVHETERRREQFVLQQIVDHTRLPSQLAPGRRDTPLPSGAGRHGSYRIEPLKDLVESSYQVVRKRHTVGV